MPSKPIVDYGQDAPGLRKGMFFGAIAGLIVVAASKVFLPDGWIKIVVAIIGSLAAAYGAFMGGYMTWGSRVGKLATRDYLLNEAAKIIGWKGNERVLDVGCGRGLLAIGAAKRLTTGTATGIDIWSNEDQAGNSPEAALENAKREAVIEKIKIDTGDARALPYADQSMDLVLSHWVVHNLKDETDRIKVLDEMWRVTRSGGVIALADIEHVAAYNAHFQNRGARNIVFNTGGLHSSIMGLLSGGSFKPQTLIVTRP